MENENSIEYIITQEYAALKLYFETRPTWDTEEIKEILKLSQELMLKYATR